MRSHRDGENEWGSHMYIKESFDTPTTSSQRDKKHWFV